MPVKAEVCRACRNSPCAAYCNIVYEVIAARSCGERGRRCPRLEGDVIVLVDDLPLCFERGIRGYGCGEVKLCFALVPADKVMVILCGVVGLFDNTSACNGLCGGLAAVVGVDSHGHRCAE